MDGPVQTGQKERSSEDGKLEISVGRYIGGLASRLRRLAAASQNEPRSCSRAQGGVLYYILAQMDKEVFQRDLEAEFGIRASSMSALLKKLEANGLIERIPVAYDGRYKKIVPTEKARKERDRLRKRMEAIEKRIVEDIPENDLAIWRRVSEQMIRNAEKQEKQI